jgi:HSP20 family protein
MYLTAFDPFTREFDKIMRNAFGPAFQGSAGFTPALPMDTVRREGEVILRFDIPGVSPEKIGITVEHGVLTVSATREEATTEGEEQFVRERYVGTVTRRIRLSDNLDTAAIEATHSDGVLELHIPVREEAKPRKIEISTRKELSA